MEKGLPLLSYIITFLENCLEHSVHNKSTWESANFSNIPTCATLIFYIPCSFQSSKEHFIGIFYKFQVMKSFSFKNFNNASLGFNSFCPRHPVRKSLCSNVNIIVFKIQTNKQVNYPSFSEKRKNWLLAIDKEQICPIRIYCVYGESVCLFTFVV